MAFQSNHDSDDVLSEINITPLVDVMLVLVVALIVTAPLLNNAIKLNLPKTVTTQPPDARKPVNVSVDARGLVYVDREQVALPALENRLQLLRTAQPDVSVHLSSDEAVNYGSVAKVMALIEHAGITRVAVLTSPQ
jgi:biopolymer transport protein ExbD/biopolymer transport protein TolR